MHPVSKMLIEQAEAIPGYSSEQLLNDLLTDRIKLVTYAQAAEEFGLKRETITAWVCRGKLKSYGTGGHGARVNRHEIFKLFTAGHQLG